MAMVNRVDRMYQRLVADGGIFLHSHVQRMGMKEKQYFKPIPKGVLLWQ